MQNFPLFSTLPAFVGLIVYELSNIKGTLHFDLKCKYLHDEIENGRPVYISTIKIGAVVFQVTLSKNLEFFS